MKPAEINNKRILLSALNWGFGHVSRSIGVLDQLQNQGNDLVIAGDLDQLEVFKLYFPSAELIELEGYPFEFKGRGNFGSDLFNSRKELIARLNKELKETEQIVQERNIDIVISDHRYGFRSNSAKSVFMTHQLSLPLKWYQKPIQYVQNRLLAKFDHIWVLDDEDNRFGGKLSVARKGQNCLYIGPYSRFARYGKQGFTKEESVLILSGPRIYAEQLIEFMNDRTFDTIISGFPIDKENVITGDWLKQDEAILLAKSITSRSGYSTIMDAHFLGAEIDLIPTPGQKEQLYLAKLHARS